ncbi:MAG: hypothetical protein IPL71_15625 [Anaerolineales bacterium]|uniref:hypothetical protein n=1 Tax=Candidatus Villigracilis proximus TaxID=3140683 RepID=UPI003134C5E1|nr:hypothetical protein [Anaerolineales bacterium]
MTSNPTFSCSACGAPNKPEAGTSRMACTYCGTNLTIPENLQTAARPRWKNFVEGQTRYPSGKRSA